MTRPFLLAVMLVTLFLFAFASGDEAGFGSQCGRQACSVHAASSPFSLGIAFALITLVFLFPRRPGPTDDAQHVDLWRRFVANTLDIMLLILALSPVAAIPLLLAEAEATGSFQWQFSRDFARPSDAANMAPVPLAFFLVLFLYFYLHARLDRPTVGQFVLGYRIVPAHRAANPSALLRVFLSFIGLGIWPLSLILALNAPRRALWWDAVTDTMAVRVRD